MLKTMVHAKKNMRHARGSLPLLVINLTTLLLLGHHVCDGYMSTMHLGRALKAFSSADQQQLIDDRSLPASTNYQLDGNSDKKDACADDVVDGVVYGVVAGAHPSWAGVQEEDDGAAIATSINSTHELITSSNEEEDLLSWSEEEYTPADEAIDRGSPRPQLYQQQQQQQQQQQEHKEEGGIAEEGELEQEEGRGEKQLTAKAATSIAAVGAVATAAADTALLAKDIAAEQNTHETHATPVTPTSAGTDFRDFTSGSEEEEEEEEEEEVGDTIAAASGIPEVSQVSSLELEELEDARLEDVELMATRELLHLRDSQDQKVQEEAARAVEALPDKKKACFDEIKAFAFGGGGGGGGGQGENEGLSEEDVLALDTVAICGDRDGVVLAFLRHSKFDVRKAKESIRRCCAWRREIEADDIFSRGVSPQKMRKHRTHWPTGFHKEDRSGRPVFYDRVGQSDLAALRADPDGIDQDEMVQIFCQNMEARRRFVLTRLSREAGRPVDQMTTVLDLTGLGVRHLSKEAVSYTRRIGDIFQDNYSGMTCSLLVVNAPWVFSKGWQIIEGFLSEDTVAKVKVLGKGEDGLKKLEAYIARENIPDFLGGESPAIVGSADPLWADVDSAMGAWANGEDPFFDRRAMHAVSSRIERQRRAATAANGARTRRVKGEVEAQEEAARDTMLEESPERVFEVDDNEAEEEEEEEEEKDLVKERPVNVGAKARGQGRKERRTADPRSGRGKHRAAKTHGRHRRSKRTDHIRVGVSRDGSPRKEAEVISPREGLDAKSRRRGKKTAAWEGEGQGDSGAKGVGAGGKEIGESALESVVKKVFPVATAVFMQVLGTVAAVAKVLLSIVEGVFLFVRDTLFEQVEVDE